MFDTKKAVLKTISCDPKQKKLPISVTFLDFARKLLRFQNTYKKERFSPEK